MLTWIINSNNNTKFFLKTESEESSSRWLQLSICANSMLQQKFGQYVVICIHHTSLMQVLALKIL